MYEGWLAVRADWDYIEFIDKFNGGTLLGTAASAQGLKRSARTSQ
jgi:hypothetical protein